MEAELLDGDLIRSVFCQELGFSKAHRDINVKRIGYISHLLNKHNVISIVAAIAPYAETRLLNRKLLERYHEIYCRCPLATLEQRDVKGLYKKARAGEIQCFTGISDVYEEPTMAEVTVNTDMEEVEESFEKIIAYLESRKIIPCCD